MTRQSGEEAAAAEAAAEAEVEVVEAEVEVVGSSPLKTRPTPQPPSLPRRL